MERYVGYWMNGNSGNVSGIEDSNKTNLRKHLRSVARAQYEERARYKICDRTAQIEEQGWFEGGQWHVEVIQH